MDYLMLIDKFNPITFETSEKLKLREVNGYLLEEQTSYQLEKMLRCAERDEIKLRIISAYRSYDYQQMLWERSVSLEMWQGASYEQAIQNVGKTLAQPGASEHNSGLAVDFGIPENDDVFDDFYKTPQAKWLCSNAADFGFILRYPRLKEHITGISYEPWHYRYVGTESAQMIKASGICLEEFLHFYSDKYMHLNG